MQHWRIRNWPSSFPNSGWTQFLILTWFRFSRNCHLAPTMKDKCNLCNWFFNKRNKDCASRDLSEWKHSSNKAVSDTCCRATWVVVELLTQAIKEKVWASSFWWCVWYQDSLNKIGDGIGCWSRVCSGRVGSNDARRVSSGAFLCI